MSEKKPLTEGHVRDMQKGFNKPTQSTNIKPTQPPPPPQPPKPATPPPTSDNSNSD